MARSNHTPRLAHTEEALTVLFCLIDDAYRLLNPHARRYESLKRLSDSEVIALALFQQLRGVESERSFLRDASEARFFSELFPVVVGLATRIAAKIFADTYAFLINRMMDRPQGRIKELWA